MIQKMPFFLGLDLNIDSTSRTVTAVLAAESLDASSPARVCAVDLPRELARHRGESASPVRQALPPGDSRQRRAQQVVWDRRLGNLSTPKSVQKLQMALHAKAKTETGYRFSALYDKIYREDILAHAYAQGESRHAF
jgi:hypothetical protein